MFVEVRSKERTVKRFATGETVGKVIGYAIVKEFPTFDQACYCLGLRRGHDGKWRNKSGSIAIDESNAYLSR